MKKVIFTLVLIASPFFVAQCTTSRNDCDCIYNSSTIDCSSLGYAVWPNPHCNFEDSTNDGTDEKLNQTVDLSNNSFSEYPEGGIRGYGFVNISYNYLSVFDPITILETKILDVSSNKIESMSFDNCKNLEKLFAANNTLGKNGVKLKSVHCVKLDILDLSKNYLNDLEPITNCENISALDVSNNFINSIPQNFQLLHRLKNASFFNNTIESLNDLPKSIVRLNISKNKLKEIKQTYFSGLEALEILDLSDNFISTVDEHAFAELAALKMLDLSGNTLRKVPRLHLFENVRNVLLMNNQIMDMDGEVVVELLNSTDREVDVRDNPFTDHNLLLHPFVLILDNSGINVVPDENCTCIDVSRGNATLKFCTEKKREQDDCWVDFARKTTTSTISITTTSPEISSVARITEGNVSRAEGANETAAEDGGVVEAAAFLGLGGAKLSFLGFLLLTFLALLVANCVFGDPVVGERWWEETLRGDRVVS